MGWVRKNLRAHFTATASARSRLLHPKHALFKYKALKEKIVEEYDAGGNEFGDKLVFVEIRLGGKQINNSGADGHSTSGYGHGSNEGLVSGALHFKNERTVEHEIDEHGGRIGNDIGSHRRKYPMYQAEVDTVIDQGCNETRSSKSQLQEKKAKKLVEGKTHTKQLRRIRCHRAGSSGYKNIPNGGHFTGEADGWCSCSERKKSRISSQLLTLVNRFS